MNHELRVVQVTNNPDAYPELAEASAEFPELVECVDDETDIFVVDPKEPRNFWPASEFFYMCGVTAFLVYAAELP